MNDKICLALELEKYDLFTAEDGDKLFICVSESRDGQIEGADCIPLFMVTQSQLRPDYVFPNYVFAKTKVKIRGNIQASINYLKKL